ncbi:MAG: metal-dependent phosphohydrolase [Pseudomonadota bacterium]
MFNPNSTAIRAFVDHCVSQFGREFPDASVEQLHGLEIAAQTSMETLLNCDCPYHDIQHTMLVTEVGQTILSGRQLARGDLQAHDWLQAVVAMLFHDVGYLRILLAEDTGDLSIIDSEGNQIRPPHGASDAFMTPYHVTRSALYTNGRFAQMQVIDTQRVAECIEMTRFPVPASTAYQETDNLPGLVRAADLIGQMGDPQYLQKLSRLYAEFVETGEAQRLGFENAGALRASFPEFFYSQVHPYIGAGITYLKKTQEGQRWVANLYQHLYVSQDHAYDPRIRAPELVVDNQA